MNRADLQRSKTIRLVRAVPLCEVPPCKRDAVDGDTWCATHLSIEPDLGELKQARQRFNALNADPNRNSDELLDVWERIRELETLIMAAIAGSTEGEDGR